jgi:hypothetical protein
MGGLKIATVGASMSWKGQLTNQNKCQ